MKIKVICIGKTGEPYLKEGIERYQKRLSHYTKLEWLELPDVSGKGVTADMQKEREAEHFFKHIKNDDMVFLMDERGQNPSSRGFAELLNKRMNASTKSLVILIGGAFGFSQKIYDRADYELSFSKMTFSHEMIRLFLVEQLYRAFTILKGESYHHD
ncbi:MAG: 23S rRNA (pseudouridine(1915)-N(3))-methyltransferase RlmH [Flavobacteriales bacterium]|jgi:23S rRNA (pseudouridine1915-N3)-methyltransferase